MNEKPIENVISTVSVSDLLRDPGGFVRAACTGSRFGRVFTLLSALTICGFGLFGLAAGSFAGGAVAVLDALKTIGIVLFGFGLCVPSLYVFTCLSGGSTSFKGTIASGLVCTATMGCVLAALSPILWLFGASTSSVAFFTVIVFSIAVAPYGFAQKAIHAIREAGVIANAAGLRAWFFVFTVVVLQAITLVRPMLAPVDTDSPAPREKCFFIQHFFKSVFPFMDEAEAMSAHDNAIPSPYAP